MAPKRNPQGLPPKPFDPLAEVILEEARRKGMTLNDVCLLSGLSWSTLMNFRRATNPHGANMKTMRKLAKGVGVKIVVETEDGRILRPKEIAESSLD